MTKYFSMFTGIGGFEIGIEKAIPDSISVGYSEIDKYAITTYEHNFKGHTNYGDATTINERELPDFDLLVGGFPCQSFSIAGKRGGFDDTRGTLFFDVARILKHKRPGHFVLENVKGLLSHDSGKTFQTIVGVLSDMGYRVEWQVLNSKDFGVPQNRERVYIVGHLGNGSCGQVFPIFGASPTSIEQVGNIDQHKRLRANPQTGRIYSPSGVSPCLSTMQGGGLEPKIIVKEATKKGFAEATVGDTINISVPNSKTRRGRVQKGLAGTLQTSENMVTPVAYNRKEGEGKELDVAFTLSAGDYRGLNRNQDQTAVRDGVRIRRLTPVECERLQGFPDNWTQGSDTQRYKQCGNAVTTNVVKAVMERLNDH